MLAIRTVSAVFWSFIESLLTRGVSIIVTLLLARFLTPEDYGLVATMTVFIAISNSVMESGIRQAVIRKLDPDGTYYSTAFFTNIALGLLAYLLLYSSAPFISEFYNEPRLILLVRIAGIVVLINSFQAIQIAILSRDLNFKLMLKANIPAAIVSGIIAIALAYLDFGVWALVAQSLISSLIVVLIFWSIQPWRPTAAFSVDSLKEMYGFGYKLLLSGLLNTISQNIYIIVIAKLFELYVAGAFFFASRIKDLIVTQLVMSIQKVTYPALSSLQQNDAKLKQGYRSVMLVTTYMLFPTMLMLAVLAEAIFELLLPVRWLTAVPYLQIMCLVGILYPLHSINLNILKVKGRSDLFLGLEIYKKIILFIVLYISYRYGVIGILIGQGIQSVLAYLPNSYFSKQLINYSVFDQLADILPNLITASGVSLLMYWLSIKLDTTPFIELIVVSATAVTVYIGVSKLLKLPAYLLIESMLHKKLQK